MVAIIDGDFIPYVYGFIADKYNLDFEDTKIKVDLFISRILNTANTSEYIGFLGGKDNYRTKLLEDYKANRTAPRPTHHASLKDYLKLDYGFNLVNGIESDDACGIISNRIEDSCIVSTDKDMLQLKGKHLHCKKDGRMLQYDVSYLGEIKVEDNKLFATGLYLLFAQLLKGDVADNYKGLKGWGDVKTFNLLSSCKPENLLSTVYKEYEKVYGDEANRVFGVMWNMAYILRKNEKLKTPKTITLKTDNGIQSIKSFTPK